MIKLMRSLVMVCREGLW